MYESVNFVLGLSSLYLGSNIQCHLEYLLLRGVNKASSAKRCKLCERTAPCNASERSTHEEKKNEKISHTANFLKHFLAHCQRTFWNFPFVSVRIISFLYYYCEQKNPLSLFSLKMLKVRRLRLGSARSFLFYIKPFLRFFNIITHDTNKLVPF